MTITVLSFASLSEILGGGELTWELSEGATVEDLLQDLERAYPALVRFERRFRVAVNQTFASSRTRLQDGGEVALIPPVSGGSGPRIHTALTEEPLDVDRATRAVRRHDCGAVVVFLGTVRDLTGDQVTERLDYSAYRAMAERELQRLAEEASERYPLGGLVLEHRLGSLSPGEVAVVVAVSSAHRDAAFEAARFLIDETKQRVPLWKKEFGPDGQAWVEGDARVPILGQRQEP